MLMHAAVPPGFMLADNGGGELFQLCHGDEHSVALMEFMQGQQGDEAGPAEQPETRSHGEINQCLSAFIAFAALATETSLVSLASSSSADITGNNTLYTAYELIGANPARAPPAILT